MAPGAAGVARDRANGSAMVSSEVQRTLVKSPPELWAELSDPVSLARHLSALGEVRITHVELEGAGRVGGREDHRRGLDQTVGLGHEGDAQRHARDEGVSLPPSTAAETETASAAATEAGAAAKGERAPQAAAASELAPASSRRPRLSLRQPPPSRPGSRRRRCARSSSTRRCQSRCRRTSGVEPALQPDAPPSGTSPAGQQPEPAPRRGLFARLFGRRESKNPAPGASSAAPAAVALCERRRPRALSAAEPCRATEAAAGGRARAGRDRRAARACRASRQRGHRAAGVPAGDRRLSPSRPSPRRGIDPAERGPRRDPDLTATPDLTAAPDLAAELLAAEEEVTAVLTAASTDSAQRTTGRSRVPRA